MKVLMLGWEFPPFFAGGAGIVCSELTKSLNKIGVDVTYIMPFGPDEIYNKLSVQEPGKPLFKIIVAQNQTKISSLRIRTVDSILQPYTNSKEYEQAYSKIVKSRKFAKNNNKPLYGRDLKAEVMRFAKMALEIAMEEEFDVIHAQDWVTFPAAMAIKEATKKPLVVHIHITEFDKTGGNDADPDVYAIERQGMIAADKVIAVSNKTRQICIDKYFIDPNKISVVHNAATQMDESITYDKVNISKTDKVVLFAGRITLQKGPDYFIEAAKKVIEKVPNTKFIMAGTGDMLPQMIQKSADMGLADKFIFTGFYTKEEGEKLFSMADVYVMPSVSEPFGIIPYEAMQKNTPTIVSKQTGISEVLTNTLKVNFWDINQLASKIVSLLAYPTLHRELTTRGFLEAKNTTWEEPATKCLNIYNEITRVGAN